jgi:hypothetical protein
MGQSSSSQPGKNPRPRGICGVGDLPPNVAAVVDHFSLDLKTYLEKDGSLIKADHKIYTASTSTPGPFSLAHAGGAPHNSSQSKDLEHGEYEVLAPSNEEMVGHGSNGGEDQKDSFLETETMDHGGSSLYRKVTLSEILLPIMLIMSR